MGLEQAFIQQILPDCPEPDKLTSFIDDQYLVHCIVDNLVAEKKYHCDGGRTEYEYKFRA